MKKLLSIIMLISAASGYCQVNGTITALEKKTCGTVTPASLTVTKKEDEEIIFSLRITDSTLAKDARKRYKLKNLQVDGKYISPEPVDSVLVFKAGKPFEGNEHKEILYQLAGTDGATCFDYIIKVERGTTTTTETLPNAPLLRLSTPVMGTVPCDSCSHPRRIVQYGFPNNILQTTWPHTRHNTLSLARRFWRGLPWVGREFTFQVVNVNPFRYDVTVEHETVVLNPDIPDFLTAAFTPSAGIRAAADSGDKKKKDSLLLVDAARQLGAQLQKKINEFRNAGDCFNPCLHVLQIDQEIIAYFQQHFKYSSAESLESFLIRELGLTRTPTDNTKDALAALNAIVELYTFFRTARTGSVSYHIPQVQNVDQYLFKLNVTPKKGIATGARVVNQEVLVDVLGGFKIDASTGLFITDLVDDVYTYKKDSLILNAHNGADSVIRWKQVINESNNKRDFGIGALFHFYPRLTRHVTVGFSLGAGATLNEKPKLRYLAGGSLLIGRSNRLAFTYGVAMGYIEKLSNKYTGNSTGVITTEYSERSVQMKKIFHSKPFFSITYNIPLAKKKTEVKADVKEAAPEKEKE